MTGLKPGKERMLGEVLVSVTVVFFQSSVENGGKIGLGGRGGRDSGHDVLPVEEKGIVVMSD